MKLRVSWFILSVLSTFTSCSLAVAANELDESVSIRTGPKEVYSNTTYVESLAAYDGTLWAATRGGLEEYDMKSFKRRAVYTTRDGLPTLKLEDVAVDEHGLVRVRTQTELCVMDPPSSRFSCVRRLVAVPARPLVESSNDRIEGVRVTTRFSSIEGTEWLGTAGLGLWRRNAKIEKRITPSEQICGNHVVAIAEWKQRSWFATFDRGLCSLLGGRFKVAALEPKMLNDVMATPEGLFVATSRGLFISTDGERFQRHNGVGDRSINDLAYDENQHVLYATASNSLWELRVKQPNGPVRSYYQPFGSRSLQAVDVGSQGEVWLASEDRGLLRRAGKNSFVGYDRLSGYASSWAIDVLALGEDKALFGSLRNGVIAIGRSLYTAPSPSDPWILFLGRDSNAPETVFVGTQGGAVVFDVSHGQHSFAQLPDPRVHAIARLGSGLWVGTEGGLARY